jgi:hypothetical protein
MNKIRSSRASPQYPADASEPGQTNARSGNRPSSPADARRCALTLDDQIAIWTHEGGAGGEVVRSTAI